MAEVWLPYRIETARTARERARGLIGSHPLAADRGLWISPCKQIHTFRMSFPIDVAFLGADNEVLHMVHRMRPRRVSKLVGYARGALELRAGTLEATSTRIGDVLRWPNPDTVRWT